MEDSNILWTELICLIAAILYVVFFKKLSKIEKWIALLLWLNVLADRLVGIEAQNLSGIIYNQSAFIQRIITLLMYYAYIKPSKIKKYNLYGLVLVIAIYVSNWIIHGDITDLHRDTYIYGGLIVAVLSYITLQHVILHRNEISYIMIGFCMGNFAYLTLMASANSAVEIIYDQNEKMGKLVYLGNDIGYAIWSLSLITAILWKVRLSSL